MRIVVAPYGYKGTFTAAEAAESIAAALSTIYPDAEILQMPLGDGGRGTLDALLVLGSNEVQRWPAHDARGNSGHFLVGVINNSITIEAAECLALADIPYTEHNPARLSTQGLGELIAIALEKEYPIIRITLGDTATHDCGLGMAAPLGYRF